MYLGIDPGIRKLGYALVNEDLSIVKSGVLLQDLKKPTREDQFARMVEIFEFFEQMVHEYPICHVGIEKLYFMEKNKNNAEFVYGARGILCMLFRKHTLPILEPTPNQIKQRVTGNGRANKELVMSVVLRLFSITEEELERHDTADALGIVWMLHKKFPKIGQNNN